MKNFSLVLNGVLIIAVGILYYLHFSDKKTVDVKPRTAIARPVDTGAARSSIAYIELDSLYQDITYIKNKKKELEVEQKLIENEWTNGYRGLQTKRDNFVKKGNAITQDMADKFQAEFLQEQQQIDEKKQARLQDLNNKSYTFMEGVQKELKEFLEEYNSQKNYMYIFTTGTGLEYMAYKDSNMNITADVIAGLNAKLPATHKP